VDELRKGRDLKLMTEELHLHLLLFLLLLLLILLY
jgi:hypothetical protein